MATVMDALGVGPELTFEGKVYRLKPMTLIHAARFAAWLERQAWEGVERARAWVPAKTHEEALARVSRDVAAGVYDFGSEDYARAAASMSGLKYLTLLSLQENHPEVDDELVDRIFAEKMARIMAVQTQVNGTAPTESNAVP